MESGGSMEGRVSSSTPYLLPNKGAPRPLSFLCMDGSSKDRRRSTSVLVWTKPTERVKEQLSMGYKD